MTRQSIKIKAVLLPDATVELVAELISRTAAAL